MSNRTVDSSRTVALKWDYLRRGAMMMSADLMANPLRSSRLSLEQLLMREAIQNSVDERRKDADGPVGFKVERTVLRGEAKARLVEKLGLDALSERSHLFEKTHGWFDEAKPTLEKLHDGAHALPILTLSDFNTNGLGGRWNSGGRLEDRFYNLVLSIGSSSKLDDGENLLGSYGVGKMVYALTSNIRTMAYYSVFEPDEHSDRTNARFLATSFLPGHSTKDGKEWTGHAFLGADSGDDFYPTKPLVDDKAHSLIADLGLKPRNVGETGLTVILIDCPLSVDACRDACERFWWPRLIDASNDDFIKLEFIDEGHPVDPPSPRKSTAFRSFVDCYQNLADGASLKEYKILNLPKRKPYGGRVCLKAADGNRTGDLTNRVALIRRGLVVKYEDSYAREGDPDAVGVFVAADDQMRAFTLAEPESHDDWNENNDRLRLAGGEQAQRLVKGTHGAIKTAFREFQIGLEKDTQAKPTKDLEFLDKILGPIFNKKKGSPLGPKQQTRAISVQKWATREVRGERIAHLLHLSLGLAEAADADAKECTVTIDFKPLGGADGVASGTVPRLVRATTGRVVAEHDQKSFNVRLQKSERLSLTAEAVVHPSWRARWDVGVKANRESTE